MIKEKELKQQLYSSEDLLAFKPPFKKYSREAVLHFLVHELKCISIDEDYAVTIDMERYTKKGALEWAFRHVGELYALFSCLRIFGYTVFKNADEIAEYILQFQLGSGFFGFDSESSLETTNSCMRILKALKKQIPNNEKVVSFFHTVETSKTKNSYPAILDIQLPGVSRKELCFGPGAATLYQMSLILQLCDAQWKNLAEKIEWIESTWEDGVGYKMMKLKKVFAGQPSHIIPTQSTVFVADFYKLWNREIVRSEDMMKIFKKHKKISIGSKIALYSSLKVSVPKRWKKQYFRYKMQQWYPETGGFTVVQLSELNNGTTAPLIANMSSTCSNSIYIEKYLKD